MNKALFGLLNSAAIISSAITNDGKIHMANQISQNNASWWGWNAMGVGNNTNISANENNSGIYGNESFYVSVNATYQADYKSEWEYTFEYNDLTSHKFGEAVITKNLTEFDSDTALARILYDEITLNISDTLKLSITIGF